MCVQWLLLFFQAARAGDRGVLGLLDVKSHMTNYAEHCWEKRQDKPREFRKGQMRDQMEGGC